MSARQIFRLFLGADFRSSPCRASAVGAVVWCFVFLGAGQGVGAETPAGSKKQAATERKKNPEALSAARIREHVQKLSACGTRIPGSEGCKKARRYLLHVLTSKPEKGGIGFSEYTPTKTTDPMVLVGGDEKAPSLQPFVVYRHEFWGTAPVDPGDGKLTATDTATGKTVFSAPLYGVWPNGPALSRTPPGGLHGALIYGGVGRPCDFNGLPVLKERLVLRSGKVVDVSRVEEREVGSGLGKKELYAAETAAGWKTYPREQVKEYRQDGAVVLLDVTDETSWTTVATLGASAVVFIEPEKALRPVLEKLWTTVPVEFPRFWMRRKEGLALRAELLARRHRGAPPLRATAVVNMAWKRDVWENLCVFIPGTHRFEPRPKAPDQDPEKLREKVARLNDSTIILTAPYDSSSTVPALAPGAGQALSCAFLLELARQYKDRPPARDTFLVFTTGHFQALKGLREFFGEALGYVGLRGVDELQKRPVELKRDEQLLGELEKALIEALEKTAAGGALPKREDLLPLAEKVSAGEKTAATAQSPGELLDVVLKRLKLRSYAREDKLRRQARLMKLLGRSRAEQEARQKEADRWRTCARFLYSLTAAGFGLEVPDVGAATVEPLRGSAASLRRELNTERRWLRREVERRIRNLPLGAELRRRLNPEKDRRALLIALDISSGAPAATWLFRGAFYNQVEAEKKFSAFGRTAIKHLAYPLLRKMGVRRPEAVFPDTLGGRREWNTYFPVLPAHGAEVAIQAKTRALTLITPYDLRLSWDTPQDTVEAINWSNVLFVADFLGPYFRRLLAHPAITAAKPLKRLRHAGLTRLAIKAVRRGGAQNIFPEVSVPGALAAVGSRSKTAGGVRLALREMTGPDGTARVVGVKQDTSETIDVFSTDPTTGEITYAVNKVKMLKGNVNVDVRTKLPEPTRKEVLELTRCRGMAFLDLLDPRQLASLGQAVLLAGQTESPPLEFSSFAGTAEEPHFVMFAEPGTRIKVLFRHGAIGIRLAMLGVNESVVRRLLNPKQSKKVSLKEARGRGFRLRTQKTAVWLPLRTATDMWSLDEYRIADLRKRNISNQRIDNPYFDPTAETSDEKPGLHNKSRMMLDAARRAYKKKDYGAAWEHALGAWSVEEKAYPGVLGTATDSVNGVVFYLFLLLPFCWFLERLLFAFPKIEQQIAAFFLLFVMFFALLWMVHPAFALIAAPPIILLAFVIVTLSVVVIVIIYGKFNHEMEMIRQGVDEVAPAQGTDVHRAGAVTAAFMLGINQMRRRKMRTFLTCTTVVLLTFAALSFTSIVTSTADAKINLSGDLKDAAYSGVLLRNSNYTALPEQTAEMIQGILGAEVPSRGLTVKQRWWRTTKPVSGGQYQEFYADLLVPDPDVRPGASPGLGLRRVSFSALLGLSAGETEIFPALGKPVSEGGVLTAGTWLPLKKDAAGREIPGLEEENVCLVPETRLSLGKDSDKKLPFASSKEAIGKTVVLGGRRLRIVGVFDPRKLTMEKLKDLDGQELTPLDFEAEEREGGGGGTEEGEVESLTSSAQTKRRHVLPDSLIVLPWRTAKLMGASLYTLAVRIDDPEVLGGRVNEGGKEGFVERLSERLDKTLLVGLDGRRFMFTRLGRMNVAGLANLIVPLGIAILILLNTMVGAVYERGREIAIFNSLGLAPSHVAMLFLAEALVYAVLGALFGYLLGQLVAFMMQVFEVQGLYLNYSSSSAVFVTAVVMGAVLLSTLYPARLAAKAAAPSEDRSWGVPPPVGNEISLELPFSFQRDIVPGVALFMYEFFTRHAESTVGKFTARETALEVYRTDQGFGVCLYFLTWLTPYDLGVSQETQLRIEPLGGGLYITNASFYRLSGYVDSWRRINLVFLNVLRKQLLIWRTFTTEQRARYAAQGYRRFRKEFEAAGWPAPPEVPEMEAEAGRAAEEDSAAATPEPAAG